MSKSWRPNRPSWRAPLRPGRGKGCNAKFHGYQSRFGDGHPSRRRCVAKAKTTGQRCRCDAMQGATTCRAHGGHSQAYRNAPPGAVSIRTGISRVRTALAKLATLEPFPKHTACPRSPVARGRIIETRRNIELGLTCERTWEN